MSQLATGQLQEDQGLRSSCAVKGPGAPAAGIALTARAGTEDEGEPGQQQQPQPQLQLSQQEQGIV